MKTPIRFLCERRDFKFSQIGNFLKLPIRCLCFSKLLRLSTSGFTTRQCVSSRSSSNPRHYPGESFGATVKSSQKLRSGSDVSTGNHSKRKTRKLTKVLITFSHFWPQLHAPVAVHSDRSDQSSLPFHFPSPWLLSRVCIKIFMILNVFLMRTNVGEKMNSSCGLENCSRVVCE